MAMMRNKFAQLLAPGLKSIFVEFLETEMKDTLVESLFKVENSKQAYEDEVIFAGFGPMPEKTENDSFQYSELVQGGTKRFVHLTYGMGARYSYELAQDDQYGIIKQVPKAIGRSGKFTRNMVPINVFNQGFSSITTGDGVSLFNNQHPLLGGPAATAVGPGVGNVVSAVGTYPNRPAVDIDLSYTGVQLMVNHFERMTDSAGIPVVLKPKTVLIPPELKFIAREIFDSEKQPYTSDNTRNAVKDEGLSYMVIPYFTSQSAWFVLADKNQHSLKFYNRQQLQDDMDDDFDTRSVKHVAFQRFSAGAVNWVGTWATNGP